MSAEGENKKIKSVILHLIKPDERKRKVKTIFQIFWFLIILFFSVVFGFISIRFFEFHNETLFQMASTIAQIFGTMLAIIISVAMYRMQIIDHQSYDFFKELMGKIPVSYLNENSQKLNDDKFDFKNCFGFFIEMLKSTNQTIEDLRNRMSNIILPMAFLVITSLIILFFSKANLNSPLDLDVNFLISITLIFLIAYSCFCLILLVYELHAVMEWKRRVPSLLPSNRVKLGELEE